MTQKFDNAPMGSQKYFKIVAVHTRKLLKKYFSNQDFEFDSGYF